jgi:hypothetical protein
MVFDREEAAALLEDLQNLQTRAAATPQRRWRRRSSPDG